MLTRHDQSIVRHLHLGPTCQLNGLISDGANHCRGSEESEFTIVIVVSDQSIRLEVASVSPARDTLVKVKTT